MQWFPLQGIMLHTEKYINSKEDHLKSLLKVFSVLNIRIWKDDTIFKNNVPDAVGIMRISCGKFIGCLLDNQTIYTFINYFVTNMVFHNVGLSWIVQSKQKPNFDLQHHCPSWILNVPWYNTMICSQFHGYLFGYYVTTDI